MADELGNDAVRRAREVVDLVVWGGPTVKKFKYLVSDDIAGDYDFYRDVARELGVRPMTKKAWNAVILQHVGETDPADAIIHGLLSKTTKDQLKKWVREWS
jgi:hypothetical protein